METQVDLSTQVTGKLSPSNIDIESLSQALGLTEMTSTETFISTGIDNFITLKSIPVHLKVYLNGLRQKEDNDYTVSGRRVIFTCPLKKGNKIVADYLPSGNH